MGKGAFIGVNGVARKIKGGYIGIDGAARKIKSAYIGVGGVARPCWGGGELEYYGAITSISGSRCDLAGSSNGSYALFAGGSGNNSTAESVSVDTYDCNLVKGVATDLSQKRQGLAGAFVGDTSLFAGGSKYNSSKDYYAAKNTVDSYNQSLVKSQATTLSWSKTKLLGASNASLAFFAGGHKESTSGNETYYNTVDIYGNTLIHGTASNLSNDYCKASASSDERVMFCSNGYMDSYDENAVKTSLGLENTATTVNVGAGNGQHMIFASGLYSHAYDSNLVHTSISPLSVSRDYVAGGSLDEYALFAGGLVDYTTRSTRVDVYNKDLVRSIYELSNARYKHASANIGKFIIFAGGVTVNTINSAEAFTVS